MGQLFFAPFDQSQRTAFVFAARVGYLRAGARVVPHEAFKPFTQILAIGRVLSTRLSAVGSAVVASMLLRRCTLVLLVLAGLRVNAASVTDVIAASEEARSPAVNVAAVYQV